MPFLDGIALSRVVQSLNPSTRILVISGVPDAEERLRGQQFYGPFLTKPFTAEKLLATICEALAAKTRKGADPASVSVPGV
jgi:DNA-binding response OmpR family regulator